MRLLDNILTEAHKYNGQHAFMGITVGTDGVPIDLILIHLLGTKIENYFLLIADEFSSVRIAGDKDGITDIALKEAVDNYSDAFTFFSEIWRGKPYRITKASTFMYCTEYQKIFNNLEERIRSEKFAGMIDVIDTERRKIIENKSKYELSEAAVVAYVSQKMEIRLKIGPPSERRIDSLISTLVPHMDFLYLFPAHALMQGEETSPHTIDNITSLPNKRILITDEPDTVEAKLKLGSVTALKYFAILGSLAGEAQGKTCCSVQDIKQMEQSQLLATSLEYVVDNIITPIRRLMKVPIYQKTNMRKIYDDTYKQFNILYKDRIPDLKNIVRPEIDNITEQLFYLLKQRMDYDIVSEGYEHSLAHFHELGISKEIAKELYEPLLEIFSTASSSSNKYSKKAPLGLNLEIMELLQRRLLVGFKVVIAKYHHKRSIYDGEREEEVVNKTIEMAYKKYGIPKDIAKRTIEFLINKNKEIQNIVISRYMIDFQRPQGTKNN